MNGRKARSLRRALEGRGYLPNERVYVRANEGISVRLHPVTREPIPIPCCTFALAGNEPIKYKGKIVKRRKACGRALYKRLKKGLML